MKKITFMAVGILLVIAMVGAGTWAYFSDTETSTGNTFTAGTIVLALDGQDNNEVAYDTTYFNVGNMAPGDIETAYIEIDNSGTLDLLFRVYLDSGTLSDDLDLDSQLLVTVTLNPSGYTPILAGTLYGPANTVLASGVTLNSLLGPPGVMNNLNAAGETPPEPLKTTYLAVYKLDITLPMATPNAYQGAVLTGNLVVEAVQYANQTFEHTDEVVTGGTAFDWANSGTATP